MEKTYQTFLVQDLYFYTTEDDPVPQEILDAATKHWIVSKDEFERINAGAELEILESGELIVHELPELDSNSEPLEE